MSPHMGWRSGHLKHFSVPLIWFSQHQLFYFPGFTASLAEPLLISCSLLRISQEPGTRAPADICRVVWGLLFIPATCFIHVIPSCCCSTISSFPILLIPIRLDFFFFFPDFQPWTSNFLNLAVTFIFNASNENINLQDLPRVVPVIAGQREGGITNHETLMLVVVYLLEHPVLNFSKESTLRIRDFLPGLHHKRCSEFSGTTFCIWFLQPSFLKH